VREHVTTPVLTLQPFLKGTIMPIFIKLAGVKGEATDAGHQEWVRAESLSADIFRSIAEGAKDQQRSRGHTTVGDVVVVRQLDRSSTKLQENCANGTFFDEVEIHLCTQVKNQNEPYLKYKLKNVIISGYSCHAVESGNPLPSEEVTLNCTEAEWTYVVIDPKTGDNKGSVPAKYSLGEGKS
jgi:type VI secretion system secreted protein Hcp